MVVLMQHAGFTNFRIFTSIRDANGMFNASRAIRSFGKFDMLAPVDVMNKLAGRGMQMIEALVKVARPDAGEDLVVLAERDA